MQYIASTYIDNDLERAIELGNEITFICDEYYLVEDKYATRILKSLGHDWYSS